MVERQLRPPAYSSGQGLTRVARFTSEDAGVFLRESTTNDSSAALRKGRGAPTRPRAVLDSVMIAWLDRRISLPSSRGCGVQCVHKCGLCLLGLVLWSLRLTRVCEDRMMPRRSHRLVGTMRKSSRVSTRASPSSPLSESTMRVNSLGAPATRTSPVAFACARRNLQRTLVSCTSCLLRVHFQAAGAIPQAYWKLTLLLLLLLLHRHPAQQCPP